MNKKLVIVALGSAIAGASSSAILQSNSKIQPIIDVAPVQVFEGIDPAADADGDLIVNLFDKCPLTMPKTLVNIHGCPIHVLPLTK